MDYRTLGRSPLKVSLVCLGGNVFGWTVDEAKSPRGKNSVDKCPNDRGRRILAALDTVAARTRSKPGRVAVAWLLARPAVTAPIAGVSSLAKLAGLEASVRLKLSAEDSALRDRASAESLSGDCHPGPEQGSRKSWIAGQARNDIVRQ